MRSRIAYGVLTLSGDGDYPYAVPMSYVFDGMKLYFQSAKYGHKWDASNETQKLLSAL